MRSQSSTLKDVVEEMLSSIQENATGYSFSVVLFKMPYSRDV